MFEMIIFLSRLSLQILNSTKEIPCLDIVGFLLVKVLNLGKRWNSVFVITCVSLSKTMSLS